MKSGSRANALLVELLLVILCFMFASVTLVELFGSAKQKSTSAKAVSEAALDAQNIAEELYRADETEAALRELGFTEGGNGWTLQRENYELLVTEEDEEQAAGTLRKIQVQASREGTALLTLPSTRYLPKEGTP